MIELRLDKLLLDRKISITKMSEDTGLSRTTINSLAKGYAKGADFQTLDTICPCLGVGLNELIYHEINSNNDYKSYNFDFDSACTSGDISVLNKEVKKLLKKYEFTDSADRLALEIAYSLDMENITFK